MPTSQSYDLAELAERYEILGELAGNEAAATYIARRRDDGADAQIAVHASPQGDEGNALSHLAADVNLLAGASHPGLVPILEGKWVEPAGFAIVTRRIAAPTLEELLHKREEEFSLPRIAAILSQVNGTLAWARERKVVHRCVTPRTIHVEAGTDRPLASFAVRALPLTEMPGSEEDAKTIAQLARAMLTRDVAAPERADRPLRELRPTLPETVLAQTEALLAPGHDAAPPDVIGYIGAIAMADALKAGEEHLEATRNLIEDQKRAHQAQLEQERREHDTQLADERMRHQKAVDEQAKKFQKEREAFERQLAKDNEALAKERAALAAEREAHRRDCERLRVEREKHEREITQVREQLEWEQAALATRAELYAHTHEFKTPEPSERPLVVPDPSRPAPSRSSRASSRASSRPSSQGSRVPGRRLARLGKPAITAAIAALVVLIAVAAVALSRGGETTASVAGESPRVRVLDSVAGGVESLPVASAEPALPAPPTPPAVLPPAVVREAADDAAAGVANSPSPAAGLPPDLLSSVAARADSAPKIPWWRRVLRRNRDTLAGRTVPAAASPDTTMRLDTIFATPVIRRDTLRPSPDSARRDSIRRDSLVIRDTLGRRRDTLVARDTLAPPRAP